MMILTGKTIVSAIGRPYPYGGEFVQQFLFALRLCWFPLMISTIAFGYAAPGLQASNFLTLFGANDRLGGFFVLASIREFAPFVTAIVLAGVAGTAITADLGARKIREELDALQVLGVDPVKNLVVPRFLALMLVTGLFDVYAMLFGIFGGLVANASTTSRRPVLRQPAHQRVDPGPLGLGPEVHAVRRDHRRRLLLQGHDRLRRRRGRGPRRQPGRRHRHARRLRVQLRVHADAAGHPPRDPQHQVNAWLAVPRDWLASFGEIVRFCGASSARSSACKVFRYFGEALRQAGVLILSSTLVIWGLTFIIGLQCGIEAAYFNRADGAPRTPACSPPGATCAS
jgi:ABC-type transporter Mla maintaining outer membrane lipid asymmetry permease subunit MlaE